MSDKRTKQFRRNQELEKLIHELNSELSGAEERIASGYQDSLMNFPLLLVMGPLRSGTTLFMQWMANSGVVAYPTNLLSRFFKAPILGAKIQLLLTDPRFNFRDELGEFLQSPDYRSVNGKTRGVLSPNEFWYFWRRFFEDSSRDVWSDAELRESFDSSTLRSELIGITEVFQKPFAAKGMLFNYNIPFLDSVVDNVVFVQMKRDIATNADSVLQARERQLGDRSEWYSFKIPEYEKMRTLDPVAQAIGQVYFIDRAVTKGLAAIPGSRKVVVHYEEFCANPARVFEQVMAILGVKAADYKGPKAFDVSRAGTEKVRRSVDDILSKISAW